MLFNFILAEEKPRKNCARKLKLFRNIKNVTKNYVYYSFDFFF